MSDCIDHDNPIQLIEEHVVGINEKKFPLFFCLMMSPELIDGRWSKPPSMLASTPGHYLLMV
jgi:hypothetical protein